MVLNGALNIHHTPYIARAQNHAHPLCPPNTRQLSVLVRHGLSEAHTLPRPALAGLLLAAATVGPECGGPRGSGFVKLCDQV